MFKTDEWDRWIQLVISRGCTFTNGSQFQWLTGKPRANNSSGGKTETSTQSGASLLHTPWRWHEGPPLGMLCSARWQRLQRQSLNSSRCQNQLTSSKWILKCSEKQLKKAGKGKKNKAAAHRQMARELTGQLWGHCGTRRSSWTPDQRGDEIPLTAAAGRLVRCSQPRYGTHPAQGNPVRGFSRCT